MEEAAPKGTTYTDAKGISVTPLRNMVLLRSLKEKVTKGGIVIPDNAQRNHGELHLHECEVLAVGPGATEDGTHVPMTVKNGDRVLLHQEKRTHGAEVMTLSVRDDKGELVSEAFSLVAEDYIAAIVQRPAASVLQLPEKRLIEVPRLVPKGGKRR